MNPTEYADEIIERFKNVLHTGREAQKHLQIPSAPALDAIEKMIASIDAVRVSDINPTNKIQIINFVAKNISPLADDFRSMCNEWNLSL